MFKLFNEVRNCTNSVTKKLKFQRKILKNYYILLYYITYDYILHYYMSKNYMSRCRLEGPG